MAASTSPQPPPECNRSSQIQCWAIFLLGFFLRFAFLVWKKLYVQLPGHIYPYALEVSSIAAHLARGQGFRSPFLSDTGPTAWIAPVYPLLVAAVFKVFGIYSNASALVILSLQCLMTAATGVGIYVLGKRTLGERAARWAAWLWTVSPFFFRWPASWIWDFAASALLLVTILIVTLDVAALGTRRHWLLLGALWGIAALTNPALLSIFPFTLGYAAFCAHRQRCAWLNNLAISIALFLALLFPWVVRNTVVFGRPVFLRSNFWFEFHLGNYHYSNGMGYLGFHPGANPRQLQKYIELGEQGYIDWAKKEAVAFVKQYPGEFIELTLHRVLWFWDGTPLRYQAQEWWQPWKFWPLSAAAWLGLIFLLTRHPRGWPLYAVCLAVYPLPYYLTYPIAKYRHAIEPEMLLLCVYLATVLWSEFVTLARASKRPVKDPADG